MKIAIITDTHFGARNDNLNFNDYFYKFYENTFFPLLKERGITTCIHMGDVVDRRKYISYRIANDLRKRFIDKFKELNIDFDEVYKRTNTSYKPTPEGLSDYKSASSVERIEAFLKLGRKDPVEYVDGWDIAKVHVEKLLKEYANKPNMNDTIDIVNNM